MNKLFTKIVGAALGLTMAIGVGVAVGSNVKEASPVHAADTKVSMTTGSNTVAIKVNWNSAGAPSSNNGVRMGTSNSAGSATFSIPSGTTKFGFYAVGWNGKSTTASVSASVGTIASSTASLTSNSAATGTINANATVAITETEQNAKKEFTISGVTAASTITLTTSGSNKRLIAWDAYYVTADKTLTSIAVKTAPTTTEYFSGENFDASGLVITATYSEGNPEDIAYDDHSSDFTFLPTLDTPLKTTDTSIKISYGGKDANQSISVIEDKVDKIELSGYVTGEVNSQWNLDNVKLIKTYLSGKEEEIEGVTPTTETPIPTSYGTYTVTVDAEYSGETYTKDFEASIAQIKSIVLSTEGGVSASECKVKNQKTPSGESGTNGIKAGTGSVKGSISITLPERSQKLIIYAAAWKGNDDTIQLLDEDGVVSSCDILADNGVTANSPFTLSTDDFEPFKVELSLGEMIEEETTYTLNLQTNNRFIVWNASVEVVPTSEPSIELDEKQQKVDAGQTGTITYKTNHMNEEVPVITFNSDDTSIVEIDNSGSYNAKHFGETEVTVNALYKSNNYQDTATFIVSGEGTISDALTIGDTLESDEQTSYELILKNYTIDKIDANKSVTLTDGENSLLVYGVYSSIPDYDKIVVGGTLTARGPIKNYNGTIEMVSPKISDIKGKQDVHVTSVELDINEKTIYMGQSFELTATVSPTDAYDKSVTWTSSDDDIATVVDGLVTGMSEGKATITVTTTDGGFTDECAVTVNKATIFPRENYQLVRRIDDIKAGDYIIIAEGNKAAGPISDKAVMDDASITLNDDKDLITKASNDVEILVVGGTTDSWTLSNSFGEKLGATAVKSLSWDEGTTTWSISIDENGDFTIQNGTSDYGRFLHNVNSSRFTTYTSNASSSMVLPKIYKYVNPSLLAARNWSMDFISNYVCNSDGTKAPSEEDWTSFSDKFSVLSNESKSLFKSSEISDVYLIDAVAKYDYIVGKYGSVKYADFMERNPSPINEINPLISINNIQDTTWIIVIVGLVSLTAVGGYISIRRRKED